MRVFVDGIVFSLQRHGGISVYFREILERLRRDRVDATLSLFEPVRTALELPAGPTLERMVERARLLERYRDCRCADVPSVFHSSYYRLPDARMPTVVTVHDFVYERYVRGSRRWIHSQQKFRSIRAADAVICISEATRRDLMQFVPEVNPERVHVIHNGVSEAFRPLDRTPNATPFVLFVGQRGGYKNFRVAAEALEWLPELQLWCVGGGDLGAKELEGLAPGVAQRIRHVGVVTDEELNTLYNDALCLAYPSSYEGFGIPVVEAMRAGCPVVSGASPAIVEVGGDALIIGPLEDPRGFAQAIETAVSPTSATQFKVAGFENAARFSWETCYRNTIDVYRTIWQERSRFGKK